jgi:opacity protein-like surface antigen
LRGWALAGLLVAMGPWPAAAQHGSIGPEVGIGEYREAAPSLRYRGAGPGIAGSVAFHHVSAEAEVVSIRMNPTGDSQATESFRATSVNAWLRWDALPYLGIEIGLARRSTDSEFAAQSLGALRVGARTHHLLGPGVAVWLRGNYLAFAAFSGGGSAPIALELGLGLDIRWSNHLRAGAQYSFQRLDRKTNPAGGPEASVPIEQALARVGLAVAF